MIRQTFKGLSALLVIGLAITCLAPAAPTQAATRLFQGAVNEACEGTRLDDTASSSTDCADGQAGSRVSSVLKLVLNVFSWIVGIIAIIMMIIGGLRYITSGGDSNSVNSAKNTILYAAVGLVIVAMAQAIVRFVVDKAG